MFGSFGNSRVGYVKLHHLKTVGRTTPWTTATTQAESEVFFVSRVTVVLDFYMMMYVYYKQLSST